MSLALPSCGSRGLPTSVALLGLVRTVLVVVVLLSGD
jgi:hypothetical protein